MREVIDTTKVIAFYSYLSRLMESSSLLIAIGQSGLRGNVIAFYSYHSVNSTYAIMCNTVMF
jgi:hypothetical protein